MVNIKLDKTGGLTEALLLKDAATQEGYAVMVGCMVGTSLPWPPRPSLRMVWPLQTLTARCFWPKTVLHLEV